MTHDNVLYSFVGNAHVTSLPSTEGNIAIQLEDNTYGDGAGGVAIGSKRFRIVRYNKDGLLEYSPYLRGDSIISAKSAVYSAPAYTKKTVTIPDGVAKDEVTTLWFVVKDKLTTYGNKAMMKSATYKTIAATEEAYTIASRLLNNFNANMLREPEKYIAGEVIMNHAGGIIGTGAGTAAVVNGSKVVTFGTDVDDATGADALAVGVFIRFGTAVTDPVYLITAIDTTAETITLDRAYAGASNAAVANNAMEQITAVQGAAAVVKLEFTAQARTNFEAGLWRDMNYDFDLLGGDLTTAVVTSGKEGYLTENKIKECEWFAMGNRGYGYRVDFIPVASQLTSDSVYTTLLNANGQRETYIKYKDSEFTNVVGQSPASIGEIRIFLPAAQSIELNKDLNTATGISGLTVA